MTEGACIPDHDHDPTEVTLLLNGEVIAHICRHCLVQLRQVPGIGYRPYSDDGRPLPTLPDPGIRSRR